MTTRYPKEVLIVIKPDSVNILDRKTRHVLKRHALKDIKSWGVSCIYFVINFINDEDKRLDKEYFYTL